MNGTMEYIGGVTAYGPNGEKHTFAVYRGHGFNVEVDGRVELTGATHSCAFSFIQKEANRRDWKRRERSS